MSFGHETRAGCSSRARRRGTAVMWSRRVGMLAVVLRSVHLSGVPAAAFVPPFPAATCQIINSTKRSVSRWIVPGGRPVASTAAINSSSNNNSNSNSNSSGSSGSSNSISNRVPAVKYIESGGSKSAAPRRRGGRGMSSSRAYGRGGGRSRGGGRARSPPDYGPNRAGQHRANVSPGTSVEVIQKQDQRTGRLTSGTVSRLLTNSGFHPRGIKVMLAGGVVGRVQNISGVGAAEPTAGNAGVDTAAGYLSGSSYSNAGGSGVDSRVDPTIVASSTVGTRRRRRDSPVERVAHASTAVDSAVSAPARSSRPVRKFRAERVQGRSWSIEGGEVVARGAGGEEIRGAGDAFDDGISFDSRRGRGRRGRGRR